MVHEDERLYIEIVIDFKQGELDDDVSSKVFQQHSSTLAAVCILLCQLLILIDIFCVYSWCGRKYNVPQRTLRLR